MLRTPIYLATASLVAMAALGACTSSTSSTTSLTAALSNATTASGELACAPTTDQITACSGKAAADACTLTLDKTSVAGTCRTSIDGAVGCAPNPPAPSAARVTACAGKATGDACTLADADADEDAGICAIAH